MKKLAVALTAAFTLASSAVATPAARACGGYGAIYRERAEGRAPQIARKDGQVVLALREARLSRGGEHLTRRDFTVIDDDTLQRLERTLERRGGHALSVTVREVAPGTWQVTGFAPRTKAG